jgi:hypothetical protein
MNYQIAYNATTNVATIQYMGDALLPSTSNIGNFVHDGGVDLLGSNENHVFYHHVKDALELMGKINMQFVRIDWDRTYVALTSFVAAPATVSKAVGTTQQITNTFTPTNASNQVVSYSSSNTAKATVSASGLITAVQAGTATITVTSSDGAFTRTVVITVT